MSTTEREPHGASEFGSTNSQQLQRVTFSVDCEEFAVNILIL